MVYVGGRFTSTRASTIERRYHCRRCGLKCRVEIAARGVGTSRSPYFLDNAGAARRASDDAVYATGADADRVVALARCPRCRARNYGAWATHIVARLVGAAFLVALGVVPAALLHASSVVLVVIGSALAAPVLGLLVHRVVRGVDHRMRVVRDPGAPSR